MKNLILLIWMILSHTGYAISRFEPENMRFTLQEQDMPSIPCTHSPLRDSSPEAPNLPWWFVKCGQRVYVVDVWYEESFVTERQKSLRLMYHVKESAASSGEKRTQFKTHVTDVLVTKGESMGFRSFLDVRNGTADLLFEGFIGNSRLDSTKQTSNKNERHLR